MNGNTIETNDCIREMSLVVMIQRRVQKQILVEFAYIRNIEEL